MIGRELRNLMNITEQALRRGYRENATKPKASSTRQSDWRVRLPTMTHTTEKDSTVLLPLIHQQPQPSLLSYGAINLPCSASPLQQVESFTKDVTCVISGTFIYTCITHKSDFHLMMQWPPFRIICQSFKNIHSPSHTLIHFCWEGRCDAKAPMCSINDLFKEKQTAVQFALWDASYDIENTCWQFRWEYNTLLLYLYGYFF